MEMCMYIRTFVSCSFGWFYDALENELNATRAASGSDAQKCTIFLPSHAPPFLHTDRPQCRTS